MKLKQILVLSVSLLGFSASLFANFADDDEKKQEGYTVLETSSRSTTVALHNATTLELKLSLSYRLNRWFLTNLNVLQHSYLSSIDTKLLKPAEKGAELVSWRDHDSKLPFDNIFTAKTIPSYENSKVLTLLTYLTSFSQSSSPSSDTSLPQVPDDVEQLKKLYPAQYQPYLPLKSVPAELIQGQKNRDILGALSLKGPFGRYIQHAPSPTDQNLYKIDFSNYNDYPVKDGLAHLGGTATLRYNSERQEMETLSITYDNQIYTKISGRQWDHKQRIMLATLTTDTTIFQHLLNTHMAVAGTFCAVNNRFFDPTHPLRVLMFPHQHRTLLVNNNEAQLLISKKGSIFPSVFSYEYEILPTIFKQKIENFRIGSLDPKASLQQRDMIDRTDKEGRAIEFPYGSNAIKLWDIINAHVKEYIDIYYPTDELVTNDPQILEWFDALDRYIPNGYRQALDRLPACAPNLNKDNLRRLITTFIYTASVEHQLAGTIGINYFMWQNFMPVQVPLDSNKRMTIDILHQIWDLEFLVSTPSISIEKDFSYLGLDESGKKCFRYFRQALQAYQQELAAKGLNSHTVYPADLDAGVSK